MHVPVGVAEERHPELVVGHLRDQVRLVVERHASVGELGSRRVDVVYAEVDDRARVVELGALGDGEHDSHVSTHEERERRGFEQVLEAEGVAIEGDGACNVVGVDRDLADVLER